MTNHRRRLWQVAWLLLTLLFTGACGAPEATPTASPPAASPQPAAGAAGVALTPDPAVPYPLAEPGTHFTGKRKASYEDASRGNRRVSVTVWYPALLPEGATGAGTKLIAGTNRDPDPSGAPYPLILSSTKMAQIMAPYLVSHSFTWASIDGIDSYENMNEEMIDQPLDIPFALDQVAASLPEGMEGMIDAEHAGVTGYSFDGYNALALSGARIDPEFYLAQCTDPDAAKTTSMSAFSCDPAREWDEFAAHAGKPITTSEDGLWQPMTDARIQAGMPLAGEGWWLFGERGLAAADRPTLILVATQDELYPEIVQIFERLGTPDKAFISFIGPGHMMVFDKEMVARVAHFAVAFFGAHLQGREDLAFYSSEDFVRQHDGLSWGEYAQE